MWSLSAWRRRTRRRPYPRLRVVPERERIDRARRAGGSSTRRTLLNVHAESVGPRDQNDHDVGAGGVSCKLPTFGAGRLSMRQRNASPYRVVPGVLEAGRSNRARARCAANRARSPVRCLPWKCVKSTITVTPDVLVHAVGGAGARRGGDRRCDDRDDRDRRAGTAGRRRVSPHVHLLVISCLTINSAVSGNVVDFADGWRAATSFRPLPEPPARSRRRSDRDSAGR